MDPITTTILAALVAGVTAGVTEVGKKAIVDAYEGVKKVIKTKLGEGSELLKAIMGLEAKPESDGRKAIVEEEVAAAKADQDADILAAVTLLQKTLAAHGDERIQKMLRSEGGEQIMRGRGGLQDQWMSDSPRGKQVQE
ncbi:MAG: hypothetical protein KDE56_19350 [Anaerolineales bacterium]|nr:hypothetical protein [Anaerolineales bacterium]